MVQLEIDHNCGVGSILVMAEMEGFVCPECDGVEFESAESLMVSSVSCV